MSEQKAWQDLLHEALQAMVGSIAAGGGDIAAQVRQIDALSQQMPQQTPPMLRHYLQRHSYTKALDFLEGRDESVSANC